MAEAPPRSPALLLYTLGREGGLPFARSAADPSSLFPPPSALPPWFLQASPTFLLPKPTCPMAELFLGAPEKSPTEEAQEDWLGGARGPLRPQEPPGSQRTGTRGGGRS